MCAEEAGLTQADCRAQDFGVSFRRVGVAKITRWVAISLTFSNWSPIFENISNHLRDNEWSDNCLTIRRSKGALPHVDS
jgi:hypothetical protein